jgi:hypothetical protein
LKVKHEKHGIIEIQMDLGQDDYLLAIEAHTKGKYLRARGQLQRKGNFWLVEANTALEIAMACTNMVHKTC